MQAQDARSLSRIAPFSIALHSRVDRARCVICRLRGGGPGAAEFGEREDGGLGKGLANGTEGRALREVEAPDASHSARQRGNLSVEAPGDIQRGSLPVDEDEGRGVKPPVTPDAIKANQHTDDVQSPATSSARKPMQSILRESARQPREKSRGQSGQLQHRSDAVRAGKDEENLPSLSARILLRLTWLIVPIILHSVLQNICTLVEHSLDFSGAVYCAAREEGAPLSM
jgi:hypothetical protein